MFSKLLT